MRPFGLVNITSWIAIDAIETSHLLMEKKYDPSKPRLMVINLSDNDPAV